MPKSNSVRWPTRLAATAIAVAAGVAVAGVGCALAGYLQLMNLRGINERAADLVRLNMQVSMSTLRSAAAAIQPRCTEESLYQLRVLAMGIRFVSEYAMFNDRGELMCSTTVGVLPRPILIEPPDAEVVDGSDLFQYNFNLRLKSGNVGAVTSVVRLGAFAAVTNPAEVEGLYRSGVDRIVFVGHGGRTIELFASDAARQTPSLYGAESSPSSAWRIHSGQLVVSTHAVGVPFVVESISSAEQIAGVYRPMIVSMGSLAVLVALLAHAAVLPALINRRSLDNRLDGLLMPGNIVCLYQPVVELANGRICGCEALMRLRVGDEIVYPDLLVPIALKRGLTQAFDAAVMGRLAQELRTLSLDAGFKLSVNFFPTSFEGGGARRLLEQHFSDLVGQGVRICVEVIEQHATSEVMAEVSALKRDGFEISIDDFGTGYSNLGAVQKMAPHFLKIDRSFVREMEDGAVRSSLIPEIIAIARAVNAKVIAEGIENPLQAKRLADLGVEYGQGYYFSRPVPLADFAAMLEAQRKAELTHKT
nr:cyclic diguanylate phosphodiesterase [uncultured Roseateles sp.]